VNSNKKNNINGPGNKNSSNNGQNQQ